MLPRTALQLAPVLLGQKYWVFPLPETETKAGPGGSLTATAGELGNLTPLEPSYLQQNLFPILKKSY